jgi:hypothetical protein
MKKLLSWWPIICIGVIELILIIANTTAHTWLVGWDNLIPELNFPLNITRSIFGVWLEYRGTGLYDGMSHIANLLHTLTIWGMSLVLPQQLLRYAFTFLTHIAGGIGAYFLITTIFNDCEERKKQLLGCIGALFYMLNLATIQMFFTPLEAYDVHFASLPWFAWSLITYYHVPTKRTYVRFLLIALAATPQFFVTTMILPIGILLGSISLAAFVKNRRLFPNIITILLGFLAVNAFWLLPYLWGLPHNAPVIAGAKINQMSSNEIFLRNSEFGGIKDVLLLRGFSLNFEDTSLTNTSVYMMAPWRRYINTPLIQTVAWIFALITLLGLAATFTAPKKRQIAFGVTFLAAFIFLATDTPLIRETTTILQGAFPFFREAFRFTFTKFSLLFALSYAVLLAAGFEVLTQKIRRGSITIFCSILVAIGIITLSLPAFQGNFLYTNLRITIPDDYSTFFEYMKKLDPADRMAILPQPAYWSWKLFRFGYRGSGFFWQGTQQATMDRAFDPWSNTNENYYWELSKALYAKDSAGLASVFQKYNIRYILLDEYLLSASHYRSLFIDETKQVFSRLPNIKQIAVFGKLTLYEYNNTVPCYISLIQNAPSVYPPYQWTDNDVAYREIGDYVTRDKRPETRDAQEKNITITYPFRSLFTKRSVSEREFTITENDRTITVSSLVEATAASMLKTQALTYDSEQTGDLKTYTVTPCGLLKSGKASGEIISDHASSFLRFTSNDQRGCLSFDIPTLEHKNGYLVAVESRHVAGRPMMFSLINMTAKHTELETYLPEDPNIKTSYFILPPLASDGLGYTIYVSNDSIGKYPSVNDLRRIRVYQIPYDQMVNMHTGIALQSDHSTLSLSVDHPNPAYYKVTLNSQPERLNTTLILSQSYDPGWIAWGDGTLLPHVLVNNWENGWILNPGTNGAIYIFFWPQLLEFLGFALLPIPFLVVWKTKRFR